MKENMEKNTGSNASYIIEINNRKLEIEFLDEAGKAIVDGKEVSFNIKLETPPDNYSILFNNESYLMSIEPDEEEYAKYRVHTCGYDYSVEALSKKEAYMREYIRSADTSKKENVVKAPMPGLIIKTNRKEGDAVQRAEGIIIMEAMKMENEIKSSTNGVISKLHVSEGDAVEKGQILFEII